MVMGITAVQAAVEAVVSVLPAQLVKMWIHKVMTVAPEVPAVAIMELAVVEELELLAELEVPLMVATVVMGSLTPSLAHLSTMQVAVVVVSTLQAQVVLVVLVVVVMLVKHPEAMDKMEQRTPVVVEVVARRV